MTPAQRQAKYRQRLKIQELQNYYVKEHDEHLYKILIGKHFEIRQVNWEYMVITIQSKMNML